MGVRPRLRPDLEGVVLDGELVLHDPVAARVHHLDVTATLVASLLDGERTTTAVVDELLRLVPNTPRSVVDRDVMRLLASLEEASLLDTDAGSP